VGASWLVGADKKGSTSSFYVTCKTNFSVNRKEFVVFPIGFHDKNTVLILSLH
jgi:hypothetical protein